MYMSFFKLKEWTLPSSQKPLQLNLKSEVFNNYFAMIGSLTWFLALSYKNSAFRNKNYFADFIFILLLAISAKYPAVNLPCELTVLLAKYSVSVLLWRRTNYRRTVDRRTVCRLIGLVSGGEGGLTPLLRSFPSEFLCHVLIRWFINM